MVMFRPILRVVRLFLDSVGGGAWPFLFGEVIRLVDYFNDRDLSLLNSVQHDTYLTTSHKDIVCVTQGSSRQKIGCAMPFYVLCFATVASSKLILCGPICVDCKCNFALDSKRYDFSAKMFCFLSQTSRLDALFA